MCAIVCQECNEPIGDDKNSYQLRKGFIERGDFVPELEIAYYHVECLPIQIDQSTK